MSTGGGAAPRVELELQRSNACHSGEHSANLTGNDGLRNHVCHPRTIKSNVSFDRLSRGSLTFLVPQCMLSDGSTVSGIMSKKLQKDHGKVKGGST